MVAPNICGSWVWNLLLVTFLPLRILQCLLRISANLCTPNLCTKQCGHSSANWWWIMNYAYLPPQPSCALIPSYCSNMHSDRRPRHCLRYIYIYIYIWKLRFSYFSLVSVNNRISCCNIFADIAMFCHCRCVTVLQVHWSPRAVWRPWGMHSQLMLKRRMNKHFEEMKTSR